MKYYVEGSLRDFKASGGAVKTLEILEELGRTEEVEAYIEKKFEDISDADINDFLWFESIFIFRELLELTEEEMEEVEGLYWSKKFHKKCNY